MQTGILNHIGKILWNPETKGQVSTSSSAGWDALLQAAMKAAGIDKHDPTVRYDDFNTLFDLASGTAYTCIDLRASAVASQAELKLYLAKQSSNNPKATKYKELTKEQAKFVYSQPHVKRFLAKRKAIEAIEIPEHRMLDLINNVNDKLTQVNLYYLLMDNLLTYGNCFWKLELDKDNVPEWIWLPELKKFDKITQSLRGKVESVTFKEGNVKKEYPGKEIIHFHFPTHLSALLGKGPLCEAAPNVNIERNYYIYTNSNFVNMGRMGGTININGNMTEKQRETYQKLFDEKIKGAHKAAGWVVVNANEMTITPISMTAADMSLDTIWRNNREALANRFKIPLSILTMESSNRAVALQGSVDFWTFAGWPDMQIIQQELTESLCPFYDENLFTLFENPTPTDQTARNREIQTNLSVGKTTRNEERALDGEDEIEGGDILLVPNNLVPIEQAGQVSSAQMQTITDALIKRMEDRENKGD